MSSQPTDPLAGLSAQVTSTMGVETSATSLINGIAAKIAAAVAAAVALGATPAQLAEINGLQTSLATSAAALSAAIAANP